MYFDAKALKSQLLSILQIASLFCGSSGMAQDKSGRDYPSAVVMLQPPSVQLQCRAGGHSSLVSWGSLDVAERGSNPVAGSWGRTVSHAPLSVFPQHLHPLESPPKCSFSSGEDSRKRPEFSRNFPSMFLPMNSFLGILQSRLFSSCKSIRN